MNFLYRAARFFLNHERRLMSILDDLEAVVTKLAADVEAHKAKDKANLDIIAAQTAQIADLTAQLAAFQNDATRLAAATASITAADASLTTP